MANLDKLFENFRKHVEKDELEEATRASKEGVKLETVVEQLEKYVSKKDEDPTHFVQFSNINKLGIYPSSTYNTPMGIYSYPLTRTILDELKKGKLPFAQDRKFIIVFKKAPGSNILVNKIGSEAIEDSQYKKMMRQLFSKEAAKLSMNSDFFQEASAYKHGFTFSQTISGKLKAAAEWEPVDGMGSGNQEMIRFRKISNDKQTQSNILDDLAEAFSAFIENKGEPFDATMERLRKDSATDSPAGKLSPVWGVVYYILQDWGSYPYGEVRSYEEIVEDFSFTVGRTRLREIRNDNYQFFKKNSHYYKDITSVSQLPKIVFNNPASPTSRERAHQSQRDEGIRRLKVYSKHERELKNLKKLFKKKHYDVLLKWLTNFEYSPETSRTPDNKFKNLGSREERTVWKSIDALWYEARQWLRKEAKVEPVSLNPLEVIAQQNKEKLYRSSALAAKGKNSSFPPLDYYLKRKKKKEPEELTSVWKEIHTYSNNQNNLGKLWYGSMLLAGDSDGTSRGMKIWRNILQGLWGIDGVVDLTDRESKGWRSSVIIHSSEPTQAVFFSKSAIKHITTLKNTETPQNIARRKRRNIVAVQNVLKYYVLKEYDELYKNTFSIERLPDEWKKAIFQDNSSPNISKTSSPEEIRKNLVTFVINEFHSNVRDKIDASLFEDPDYWKRVFSSKEPDKEMANLRRKMSIYIFHHWSKSYLKITEAKTRILMYLMNITDNTGDMVVNLALLDKWGSKNFVTKHDMPSRDLPKGMRHSFTILKDNSYDWLSSRPRTKEGMLKSSYLIEQRDLLVELDEGVQLIYEKYKYSARLFKAEIEDWRSTGQEKQKKGELSDKDIAKDYREVRLGIQKNFMITLGHLKDDIFDLSFYFND